MRVTVIRIVIDALGTVPKGLISKLVELKVGGRARTIQATALFRSPRILRRVLVTLFYLLRFGLVWFYGISTIIGYLIPNPFNTYKLLYFKQFSLA